MIMSIFTFARHMLFLRILILALLQLRVVLLPVPAKVAKVAKGEARSREPLLLAVATKLQPLIHLQTISLGKTIRSILVAGMCKALA